MLLAMNIYLFACALLSLGHATYVCFKHSPPIYFRIISFSMASIALSRLYYIVSILCYGEIPHSFNVGFVGFGTFFLYVFFANRGQIDILVDDNSKKFSVYKVLPNILPLIEFGLAVRALFIDFAPLSVRISLVVLSVFAGLAGYYNVKHLLIKDVEFGIVRTIRGFNALCLMVGILTILEIGLYCYDLERFITFGQIILGLLYLIFLPILHKEVQKWTK